MFRWVWTASASRITASLSPLQQRKVFDCQVEVQPVITYPMPYEFEYENLFLYTIGILIVLLLYIRVRLARKTWAGAEDQDS